MTLQIWQTCHISYSAERDGVLNEMDPMTHDPVPHGPESAADRRRARRFKISAPLTAKAGDREIAAYIRDLSDEGVYFYLGSDDGRLINHDIDFVVDLPPEITLTTCCRIQCRGQVLRKERCLMGLTGVAARIVDYSIFRDAMPVA